MIDIVNNEFRLKQFKSDGKNFLTLECRCGRRKERQLFTNNESSAATNIRRFRRGNRAARREGRIAKKGKGKGTMRKRG